jgi:diguanylate cyclase (GGDEF)-like protein
MPPAPTPSNERERLAQLLSYEVLDTTCESAFDNLAKLAAQITGCPIGAVSLVDANRQWFKARYGLEATETPRDHAFCAYTILSSEPLIVPDATCDPRFADSPLVTEDPKIRFYAGVPLINPDGFKLGALCVNDTQSRRIGTTEVEMLATLAQAVMSTLDLRRALRHVQCLAATDMLTGLANRSAFLIALDKAVSRQRRQGGKLAIAYLDLDGFKRVNDTEGHGAGDRILRDIAGILVGVARNEDIVARIGGDEFAVVFGSGDGQNGAASERFRAEIAAGMAACGRLVSASVGSVCFETPPASAGATLAEVDGLMYEAKAAGKNRIAHRNWRSGPAGEI